MENFNAQQQQTLGLLATGLRIEEIAETIGVIVLQFGDGGKIQSLLHSGIKF